MIISRWSRLVLFCLGGLLCLGLAARSASAQVKLVPQVGAFSSDVSIGEFQAAGGRVDLGAQEGTVALGVVLQIGLPILPDLRASVLYAPNSTITLGGPGCAAGCGSAEGARMAITGALIFHPLPLPVVHPYLLIGGGVKQFSFNTDDADPSVGGALVDHSKVTAHLGVGVDVTLGGIGIRVELSDLVSNVDVEGGDGDLQNDFFFTVGLILGR